MTPEETGRGGATVERLGELAGLYREGLCLTTEALAQDPRQDEASLAGLLRRRTQVLARAAEVQEGVATREEDGRHYLVGLSAEQSEEAEVLLEELGATLEGLAEADQKLKQKLEEERERTGQELERVGRGHSALKAYAPYRGGISYYVNRRD